MAAVHPACILHPYPSLSHRRAEWEKRDEEDVHLRVVNEKTELLGAGSASASCPSSGMVPKGCRASHLQMGHSGFRLDSH